MNLSITKNKLKPWLTWLQSKSTPAMLCAALSFSAFAEAQTNISPPTDPFDYATCLPSIIPSPNPGGTLQLNTYVSTSAFAIDPKNSSHLVAAISLDSFFLNTFLLPSSVSIIPIAWSKNGGATWNYSNIPISTCEGGITSQTGAASSLAFSKRAHSLYFAGTYNDTELFPGSNFLRTGQFVAVSHNQGKSWNAPIIVDIAPGSVYADFEGTTDQPGPSLATDLHEEHRAYLAWSDIELPSTFYGNIVFSKTEDGGESWWQRRVIYDMAKDPIFLANNLDTAIIRAGGQSIAPALLAVPGFHDRTVLIAAFNRFYPAQGSTTYTQNITNPGDSISDHAIIRSFDGGNSWDIAATEIGAYNYAPSHDPRYPASSSVLVFDESLDTALAYSKKTGRIYVAWQGSSTPWGTVPPAVPVPSPDLIQCAVSSDLGLTWSAAAQVNTPLTNPYAGGNQAFDVNVAVTDNGYVGFIYYDFRNWTGSDTFVQTDAWLDIYQETSDPNGGSTGIGLNFVREVRLTPNSFNAIIGFDSLLDAAAGSPGIVTKGRNFLTIFTQTGSVTSAPEVIDGISVDFNNRFNVYFEAVHN